MIPDVIHHGCYPQGIGKKSIRMLPAIEIVACSNSSTRRALRDGTESENANERFATWFWFWYILHKESSANANSCVEAKPHMYEGGVEFCRGHVTYVPT